MLKKYLPVIPYCSCYPRMMWNQIVFKSRPILTQNLCLHKKKGLLRSRSAINLIAFHHTDSKLRLINNLTSQRLITLLSKHFSSSSSNTNTTTATTTDSTVTSKTQTEDNGDKGTVDDHTLDRLYEEVDQRIHEVNHFIESNGKTRQLKIYGLALITMLAGVFTGAYAAHFGAWFLDKVGLFMFQDDDDD